MMRFVLVKIGWDVVLLVFYFFLYFFFYFYLLLFVGDRATPDASVAAEFFSLLERLRQADAQRLRQVDGR